MPYPTPPTPQAKPEAQSYYQLAAATLRFKFPEPAPLDGVTSREKSILKMIKAGFTYPGATKKVGVFGLWYMDVRKLKNVTDGVSVNA